MIDGYSIAMWFARTLAIYLAVAAVCGGLSFAVAYFIVKFALGGNP